LKSLSSKIERRINFCIRISSSFVLAVAELDVSVYRPDYGKWTDKSGHLVERPFISREQAKPS
jgi:hypothetical protein